MLTRPMLTRQFHTNSAINPMDQGSAMELEALQSILNSVNTGIGLIDRNYTLLYCNSIFDALLENETPSKLGKKIYLGKGLKLKQLQVIHQKLNREGFWEGVFPEMGKGLSVAISRIDFPIPVFLTPLSEAHFIISMSDHSDMLKQQQELTNTKYLASKSEKSKSELLSHMSHELRTPLNAIQGFTQLLQVEPNLSEEQKDYLGEIMAASQYLLKLTNEILSLSKTEHEYGELKLSNEAISMKELIAECISLVKPLAQKANIQIVQCKSNTTLVKDRVRLKQVLVNLLSNAIKYNKEGGQVVIQSFYVSGNNIRIEVQDSGKGIPEQLLHTIFNPFERLGVKGNQIEGNGIGLMITRRLVNIMDGAISVVSEPGNGSIFSLDFPADPTLLDSSSSKLSEEKRNIIWIADDPNAQQFAERLMNLRPAIEFHQTEDIASASALSIELAPDLVFLDIKGSLLQLDSPSPEIEDKLKKFPIIAVIGENAYLGSQFETSLEFTSYLSTPFNAVDFMGIIDRHLYR